MPWENSSFSESRDSLSLSCAELMEMAERGIGAFISAVTELHGSEQAMLSAEDWIDELLLVDDLCNSARCDWRAITVAASARLASRLTATMVCQYHRPMDSIPLVWLNRVSGAQSAVEPIEKENLI